MCIVFTLVTFSIHSGRSKDPVIDGSLPVTFATAPPRLFRTFDGSTRASPPIGTTAPGHTRTIFVRGAISRVICTAVTPMPSSKTTASGWCSASTFASSADVAASATTSKPSPSRTKRSSPLRMDCPSPTTMRTRWWLIPCGCPPRPLVCATPTVAYRFVGIGSYVRKSRRGNNSGHADLGR